MNDYPDSLQAEQLLAHIRFLCREIGPRPPASEQEQRAADYVENYLRQIGVTEIQRQTFPSPRSFGFVTVPVFAAGALASLLAWLAGQWGKLAGSALLLGSAATFYRYLFVRPPFFQKWIARGTSRNVIAHIPAAQEAKRTLYLVGHLDSQKQRFQFPPTPPEIMKGQTSLPLILGGLGGLALLADFLRRRREKRRWLLAAGAAYLWGLGGALFDETQPHVEGANDNATAVALLLGIAQALVERPLTHTNVILLFTGSEESGCVGMESYLQQFTPPTESTFWLDVEMVGAGELCYVTRHGISYLTSYAPHPEMAALAEETARQHPELRVAGKDMLIIEEIANLRHWGYKAVCLAGYDRKGFLPHWHRLSDAMENIEPETLNRAARYTWRLMQAVDRQT